MYDQYGGDDWYGDQDGDPWPAFASGSQSYPYDDGMTYATTGTVPPSGFDRKNPQSLRPE